MQCPGKQIDVTHAANHQLRLKPRGIGFTPSIQLLEPCWPHEPTARYRTHDLLKMVEEVVLAPIKADQQSEEPFPLMSQPPLELAPVGEYSISFVPKGDLHTRPQTLK